MKRKLAQLEKSATQNAERRIVEVRYEQSTRVIHFGIFLVRPDGRRARVLGGGAFEEQDVYCVAEELMKLANDFACDEALNGYFQEIEEDEGEDA